MFAYVVTKSFGDSVDCIIVAGLLALLFEPDAEAPSGKRDCHIMSYDAGLESSGHTIEWRRVSVPVNRRSDYQRGEF